MALSTRQSVEYQEAHRYQDQTKNLGGFYIVLIFTTVACMLLRVLARGITRYGLKKDDWTYLVGSVLSIGSFIVLLVYAFDAGLGKHWVTLTPYQKGLFSRLNFAYNVLNVTCYPLIKISILLLYIRLFRTNPFRYFCWGGIVFLCCMMTANTLVSIFACRPVRSFWDASVPGKCINAVQFYWSTAVLNLSTDLYILVLPMPMVWRIQTTIRRKVAISTVFALGGLTFIISILRIVYYLDYTNDDPSYSFLGSAYASPAEVCLGIVVASAPTWRPIWVYTTHMASSLLSQRSQRSNSTSRTDSRASRSSFFDIGAAHSEARDKVLGARADPSSGASLPGASGRRGSALDISRKGSATWVVGGARLGEKDSSSSMGREQEQEQEEANPQVNRGVV